MKVEDEEMKLEDEEIKPEDDYMKIEDEELKPADGDMKPEDGIIKTPDLLQWRGKGLSKPGKRIMSEPIFMQKNQDLLFQIILYIWVANYPLSLSEAWI